METLSPSEKFQCKNINEGIDFNKESYNPTNKFHIYLPKLNDSILAVSPNSSNKVKNEHKSKKENAFSDQKNRNNMANPTPLKERKGKLSMDPDVREKIKTAHGNIYNRSISQLPSEKFSIKNGSPGLKSLISYQIFKNLEEKTLSYTPKHFKIIGPSYTSYTTQKPTHSRLYERSTISFKTKFHSFNSFALSNSSFSPSPNKNQDNLAYQRVILENKDIFANKDKYVKGIERLDELKLLEKKRMNIKLVTKRGKIDYIMNDFHARATNPGFARNGLGNFYTR